MKKAIDLVNKFDNSDLNTKLIKEFLDKKNDKLFDEFTNNLDLSIEQLSKYTSLLEDSCNEYRNCKNCKSLSECKNMIHGYVNFPKVNNGILEFGYIPCKYKKQIEEKQKFLNNITLYDMSKDILNSKFSDIYTDDKNRFNAIKWLKKFIDEYPNSTKGLYLYGNFGCGKTYLISATFNELAKKGYKSAIVFWPDFLRTLKSSFDTDYSDKINYIKKVNFLLIDDIGAEQTTSWGRDEVLCPILQYRMQEHLPTFFTSNLDIKLLEQHFSNSKDGVEVLKARRIIERIKQLTIDMEMISKNLRN